MKQEGNTKLRRMPFSAMKRRNQETVRVCEALTRTVARWREASLARRAVGQGGRGERIVPKARGMRSRVSGGGCAPPKRGSVTCRHPEHRGECR